MILIWLACIKAIAFFVVLFGLPGLACLKGAAWAASTSAQEDNKLDKLDY